MGLNAENTVFFKPRRGVIFTESILKIVFEL